MIVTATVGVFPLSITPTVARQDNKECDPHQLSAARKCNSES